MSPKNLKLHKNDTNAPVTVDNVANLVVLLFLVCGVAHQGDPVQPNNIRLQVDRRDRDPVGVEGLPVTVIGLVDFPVFRARLSLRISPFHNQLGYISISSHHVQSLRIFRIQTPGNFDLRPGYRYRRLLQFLTSH